MRIQTIRGYYSRSLPEIYELLEQKRNELRAKGKYIENAETKSETYIKGGVDHRVDTFPDPLQSSRNFRSMKVF
uniref:Uncharacterized protein n=1 Tax=Meloidogyne incognita TaxID=6306 RepID=A0A914MZ99_MELIC